MGKSQDPADAQRLATSLATMAESLRLAATALEPVMPGTKARIDQVLGSTPAGTWTDRLVWGGSLSGSKVAEALVLFPRPAPAKPAPGKPTP